MSMKVHVLAAVFPLIEGKAFDEFCETIRPGLKDPIVQLDGQILDGVNRQRACDRTGVTAKYINYARQAWCVAG
jgi:hypothetical protein